MPVLRLLCSDSLRPRPGCDPAVPAAFSLFSCIHNSYNFIVKSLLSRIS